MSKPAVNHASLNKQPAAARVVRRFGLAATVVCAATLLTAPAPRAQPARAADGTPLAAAGQTATRLPDGSWLVVGGDGELRDRVRLASPQGTGIATPARLGHPRTGHTATLLPDGRVLVLGGIDAAGAVIAEPELFDPAARAMIAASAERAIEGAVEGLMPRAFHAATVLGDGRVLVSGGVDVRGKPIDDLELWSPATGEVALVEQRLAVARLKHQATLLPGGRVLIAGGVTADGAAIAAAELFDAGTGQIRSLSPAEAQAQIQLLDGAQAPAVASTTPAAEAAGVTGAHPLIARFNKRMAVASLTAEHVTLIGPAGAEPVEVVAVEQGVVAFIRPAKELLPASRYTLFIQGARDVAQRPVALTAIGFDTAAKHADMASVLGAPPANLLELGASPAPAPIDRSAQLVQLAPAERTAVAAADATTQAVDWVPGAAQFTGRWRADRAASPLQALPPLQAAAGVTALAGQVLGMDGRAVPGVTLRIVDRDVVSDVTGRFVLDGVSAGVAKLEIDGATADRDATHYGYYAARVELAAQTTTVLPYTIWMPRLDPAGTVQIAAPTAGETVVTSPRIPGLELHIPAGTVIRDRQGRIVTELNVTAIPVDRPPFPVPDLGVPTYFTIQPGGAVLQSVTGQPAPGARLFYPNFTHEVAGARGAFWNYDPEDRGWFVYGMGTITADRSQAIPDDGVVIHELTGAMFNGGGTPGPEGPPPCDCGGDGGDPVSLVTGQFNHTEHDLRVADVSPIDIARTYDSLDKNRRAFGIGMTHAYDVFFFSQNQFQEVDLILPNQTRVHYVRTSPGNGTADAVLVSTAPGTWAGSTVTSNVARGGWDLTFRDGRKWFAAQLRPISEMADANGNVTRIVRESAGGTQGNILQIVSPGGRTVNFAYNAAGLVSAVTDNIGRRVTYSYDDQGRLLHVTDPLGGTRDYAWDTTNNRITAVHDAAGRLVIQNGYDASGRITSQSTADDSTYGFAYTRDASGRTTQVDVTDRRGSVRRVQFDAAGYLVRSTFPLGTSIAQVSTFENTGGQLTASVDPLGRRTEYQHDASGNITQVTRMAGTGEATTTSFTYDPTLHLPATATDANGHAVALAYDAKGNVIRTTDPTGQIATYGYDPQGRLTTITNALGKTLTLAYEGADLVSATDPLGRQRQWATDAVGRAIVAIDPLGHRTFYEWDDLDRLASSTDALGGVTRFAYDGAGHLLSWTDARGFTSGYAYNTIGKVQRFWDALFHDETRLYERTGQLKQVIDRNGHLRSIAYDALGRATTVSYGATADHPHAFTSRVENTWDAGNRLIQIVEQTCAAPLVSLDCGSVATTRTLTRAYDHFDRKISEVTEQGEVDYAYDAAGRRTRMTVKNGPPGAQIVQPDVTYGYDAADRLTAIHQAAGAINAGHTQDVSFTYDAIGRRTRTTLANGSSTTFGYDDANQLTSIVYRRADGTAIGDLQYEYDAAGRRITMSGSLAQLQLPAQDVTDATYDANNRLTLWGGKSYRYDAGGNLIDDGTNTYQWDDRNRLAGISLGATEIASFGYDTLGRRTRKTIAAETTGYLYDWANAVQELDGATSNAAVKAHLLTGGVDELYLRLEGNAGAARTSVLSDGNNSALMLLDDAQDKLVSYAYEPYGATTADAANPNSQQFTGRENDNPGTAGGLYFYRGRYYMPGIARFISEDPIGWTSGQTNNYAYVGGDPIGLRDPSGLSAADDFENFSAGFGDALTFGLGGWLRKKLGIDGVNPCSGWYAAGEITGEVTLLVATAGVGGEAEAGADALEALEEEGVELEEAAEDGAEQAPRATEKSIKEAERELKRNKDFRDWFHREYKASEGIGDGVRSNPDLTGEQVLDAYQEWIESGRPGRR